MTGETTRIGLTTAVAVLMTVSPALPQQIPPSTAPGTIQRRLEPAPTVPEAAPPVSVPETGQPSPPPGAAEVRFKLAQVEVSGNSVFKEAELKPLWQDKLGKEISLAELWEIAAAITVRYRNAGYILSRALVPAQEIADGIARIQVVEGYVDKVIVDGEPTGDRTTLDHAIERIKASRPLEERVLERYILLLNDLPGVTARTILRPSPVEQGASELVIIWEETRFSGSVSADNFGTRFLGPTQLSGAVVGNNLYHRYDSTELRGLVTVPLDELQYLSLRHSLPVGPEGTVVTFDGSYTHTEPDELDGLRGTDDEGHSIFGSLYVAHPFIRSRSENLSLFGGLRFQNSDNAFTGTNDTSDRTRSVTAGGTFDIVDSLRGVTLFGLDVTQGMDVLDAHTEPVRTTGESRPKGDITFTRLNLSVTRDQDLGRGFSLRGAVSTPVCLRYLAGARAVRGRRRGVRARLWAVRDRWRHRRGRHASSSSMAPPAGAPGSRAIRPMSSSTRGAVWENDRHVENDHSSLVSSGVGVDLNFRQDLAGTLIVAMPLTRDPSTLNNSNDRYPRIFARLTKRF